MRRTIVLLTAAVIMTLVMAFASPAFAVGRGPGEATATCAP